MLLPSWAGGFGVRFLTMSVTSEHCMMGSVVGCVQGFGVLFLAMSGTSEHCMMGSAVGCAPGFGVQFHRDVHPCDE